MDLLEVTSWRTVQDRRDLALAPGETLVAGGTWVFSEPQPGTTGLVDLTSLGWAPWERVAGGTGARSGDGLRLSATCSVAELLEVPADELGGAAGLVRDCADALAMSFKVQHAATLGGNVCLALPAGAMTSLLVALEADAIVWGSAGDRVVRVADLVTGVRRTALAQGEVVRAFDVRREVLSRRHAFRRQSLAAHGRSGVVVTASRDAGSVRVAITAATQRPVVLEVPAGSWVGELAAAIAAVDCWHDDVHGAPDWRVAMAHRLAAEAVSEVLEEAA